MTIYRHKKDGTLYYISENVKAYHSGKKYLATRYCLGPSVKFQINSLKDFEIAFYV